MSFYQFQFNFKNRKQCSRLVGSLIVTEVSWGFLLRRLSITNQFSNITLCTHQHTGNETCRLERTIQHESSRIFFLSGYISFLFFFANTIQTVCAVLFVISNRSQPSSRKNISNNFKRKHQKPQYISSQCNNIYFFLQEDPTLI